MDRVLKHFSNVDFYHGAAAAVLTWYWGTRAIGARLNGREQADQYAQLAGAAAQYCAEGFKPSAAEIIEQFHGQLEAEVPAMPSGMAEELVAFLGVEGTEAEGLLRQAQQAEAKRREALRQALEQERQSLERWLQNHLDHPVEVELDTAAELTSLRRLADKVESWQAKAASLAIQGLLRGRQRQAATAAANAKLLRQAAVDIDRRAAILERELKAQPRHNL